MRGSPNVQAEPNISWTELRKFVSQLNHDLRNHLNAIELQSAFLSEIVREPEAKDEIKRLREMTGDLCAALATAFRVAGRNPAQPDALSRGGIFRGSAGQVELEQPELAAEVDWKSSLGEEALKSIRISCKSIPGAFCNAAAHGRGEGALVFESAPRRRIDRFYPARTEDKVRWRNGKLGRTPARQHSTAGIMALASFGHAVFLRRTMARSAHNLIQPPRPWSRPSRCPSSWLKPVAGFALQPELFDDHRKPTHPHHRRRAPDPDDARGIARAARLPSGGGGQRRRRDAFAREQTRPRSSCSICNCPTRKACKCSNKSRPSIRTRRSSF